MYLLFVDSFLAAFLVSINLVLFHMHFNSRGNTHVDLKLTTCPRWALAMSMLVKINNFNHMSMDLSFLS